MRLTDLEPEFMRVVEPGKLHHRVDSLAEAHGVMFLCPKGCGHYVLTWFRDRGVPDSEVPGPARWNVQGSSYADLTLTPSIHLTGPGCGWHGFITNGEVTSC